MAGQIAKLTDLKLRSIKPTQKTQKLSDGRGLQFWVTPAGGKYWRMEYRYENKKKLLSIGPYPEVSAAAARVAAARAREQLREGVDPSERKKELKKATIAAAEHTFGSLAKQLVEKKRKEGRAVVTLTKMNWIFGKVEADLSHRPIQEITTRDVVTVLRREEEAGNLETARRMRTVIGEVFRYAMQHGLVTSDPTQATRGAIAQPRPRNHPAIIDPQELAKLLRLIDEYSQRNRLCGAALHLMCLLYPRPGELRQADWSEFDLNKAVWTIPAARTKMRRPHAKPLAAQALQILRELKEISGPVGYVFRANGRPGRPMSENTLNAALRRMGVSADVHTAHGFRSTASTILNDSNQFSADAIERELAHQDEDAIRRVYRRGDAMVERVRMAQWWADCLDRLRTNTQSAST
ncbi:MAG: integrase arm-type DNA-binding domain-containing protein [Aestuariivirga sp.]|uniref:tyrosine-type recombinase/integrase n=1 Tax=Aestuariivirga sp. TaxID=2650926 RepID=UPI0030160A12